MAEILFPVIDPVLLSLGPIQIRWYGLMYVVGFFAGQWMLTRFARRGFWPLPEAKVADLILWLILGVILGGRIGFCLFYRPDYLSEPLQILRVWEGGLAFHGGLLGVVVAFVWFSWRHRADPWRIGDCVAMATVPGIFAVRIANFVNGELYGRVTDASVPWAMRFPTDPVAAQKLGLDAVEGLRAREVSMLAAMEDGRWESVREQVPLRHPSQIYEAIGEGLLLGLVLWLLYRATREKPLSSGVYGGVFVLGYGVVRFVVEFFRQPDAQFRTAENPMGTIFLGLSMGQLLCMAMIAVGAGIVIGRRRRG
jgi:phosphatidylglycerol:prolipoprotein diacylglycerol transferase